jgi:hypothetical protein
MALSSRRPDDLLTVLVMLEHLQLAVHEQHLVLQIHLQVLEVQTALLEGVDAIVQLTIKLQDLQSRVEQCSRMQNTARQSED